MTVSDSQQAAPGQPRVLLIDDEVETLSLLEDQLGEHFTLRTAKDGKQGYAAAVEWRPDCIISDVNMPGLSGLEFLRKLRSNATLAHIPVILLSAMKDDADRIRGYQELADLYLTKPYNAEELLVSILGLLRIRQHLQSRQNPAASPSPRSLQMSVDDEVLMQRIEQAVHDNLGKSNLEIAEIAAACFISKRHLERKLKELRNMSPAEYIRLQRMEQAWKWLEQGRYRNINELSHAVGYTSHRTFTRVFKRTFGMTPSDLLR